MWYRKSKRKERTDREKKMTNKGIQMLPIIIKQEAKTALTNKGLLCFILS